MPKDPLHGSSEGTAWESGDRLHVPDDRLHSGHIERPARDAPPPQQAYIDELVRLQHERSELGAAAYFTPVSAFLSLPNLRAFWPLSSADENGDVYDVSGQGRTLTKNNTITLKNQEFTPYADFDATGYFDRADEAGLDISADLTLGCWVRLNSGFADVGLIGKTAAAMSGNLGYLLDASTFGGAERFTLRISGAGSSFETVHVEPAVGTEVWHFVAGRFTNTAAAIFCNTQKATSTFTASTINTNAQALELGRSPYTGTSTYLDGYMAFPFLCAAALEDEVIAHVFEATRPIFGR